MRFEDYLSGACGSFAKKIAEAFLLADINNQYKLKQVFPDIYDEYYKWYNCIEE